MEVNTEKSNIMDFRRPRQSLGTNIFRLGERLLDTVSKYKYLGFYLDEHVTYMERCTTLSGSPGHSLLAIINKLKILKGEGYGMYTKLYDSCVTPILEYFSGIWGSSEFDCMSKIQQCAI